MFYFFDMFCSWNVLLFDMFCSWYVLHFDVFCHWYVLSLICFEMICFVLYVLHYIDDSELEIYYIDDWSQVFLYRSLDSSYVIWTTGFDVFHIDHCTQYSVLSIRDILYRWLNLNYFILMAGLKLYYIDEWTQVILKRWLGSKFIISMTVLKIFYIGDWTYVFISMAELEGP